jgi:hypothetical protein
MSVVQYYWKQPLNSSMSQPLLISFNFINKDYDVLFFPKRDGFVLYTWSIKSQGTVIYIYIYIYMLESWNCPRNWLAVTMKDIHVLWSFRRMKAKVPFMLNMWVQIFASIWRPLIANKSGIGQILAFLFNNLGYRISLDSCG